MNAIGIIFLAVGAVCVFFSPIIGKKLDGKLGMFFAIAGSLCCFAAMMRGNILPWVTIVEFCMPIIATILGTITLATTNYLKEKTQVIAAQA